MKPLTFVLLICAAVLAGCSPSAEEELYKQAIQQEGSGATRDARAKYVEITQRYPASKEARMALERISALDTAAAASRARADQESQTLETHELMRKQVEAQRVQTMEQEERALLHPSPPKT